MITEAIVLAGGLGTRLKAVVPELPKSLAPVAGKPFLSYLLDYAQGQGVEHFVFALGYKTDQIEAFVRNYLLPGSYSFSIEESPLGTGGAVYQAACTQVSEPDCMVLNADTFFAVPFLSIAELHQERQAACTLALKPMTAFERYGAVDVDPEKRVTGFHEKRYRDTGWINGGVYALNIQAFCHKTFPAVFSFEKDYLEKEYAGGDILGMISDAYFIDIGIPEDYYRAQTELPAQITKKG